MKEGSVMIEILVNDDDRGIWEVMRKARSRENYRVTALDDPIKVNEKALARYQLIILDVMMPGIEGYEL